MAPPAPVFKRYFVNSLVVQQNASSPDLFPQSGSIEASPVKIIAPLSTTPSSTATNNQSTSLNSFTSAASGPNVSVDTSDLSSKPWLNITGRRSKKPPTSKGLYFRGQNNLHHDQDRTQIIEEEMNSKMAENINVGTYYRRDKSHATAETSANLKQFHTNAIRLYCTPPPAPMDPYSWLSCEEIPTSNEIMDITEQWQHVDPVDDAIIMRGNNLTGPWPSKDTYLGSHFEMLREDATRPLREAIRWVKSFPKAQEDLQFGSNIGIYDKVHITTMIFSARGLGIRVNFSLAKVGKNVRWEQSKRLLTGTIVALTPSSDMFRTTCIIAVVAARPLDGLKENPPMIDLFFARPEEIEIDPTMEFTMVEERSSFFEAGRYTMLALQKMMQEPFPFAEQLIEVQSEVAPPTYVARNPITDMTSAFSPIELSDRYENVDIIKDWPSGPTTNLDKSQKAALRRILTKKVAIVQGPPGTGKTHVSVMALKVMLENWAPGDPPIIVACQTNHALDQLLRHIARFEENFIRLGGRSKDTDVIKKRTLYVLRQGKQLRVPGGMRHSAKILQGNLISRMSKALVPLEMGKGLLDHKLLFSFGLLTRSQVESLERGDSVWSARAVAQDEPPLKRWLGKQLLINTRTFERDHFGYEYEEADLEFEQVQELEAENSAQDDDDDFESLRGPAISLWDAYVGKIASNVSDDDVQNFLGYKDLYKIPTRFRGVVYSYLQRLAKDKIRDYVREQSKIYYNTVVQFKAGGWERDAILLRQMETKMVGLTGTGLSKYRALIASLNPKILVVEEAAEAMEAPVIAGCVPSLAHLILVGDHQQLRPQCAVKDLQKPPFSLNVSLFERLINNNVEYSMLKRQRRMIPEIRRVLKPIYGSAIVDHFSMKDVFVRPPVPGMGGINSFFYCHNWPESVDEQMSAMNQMEADMIVGFFDYLVHNDIADKEITVLTFYNGQRKLLLRRLREHPNLGRSRIYKVVTVDSYQGEENDVVILSLVRSNDEGRIGFLDVENRICVALSRAKRGFYIFGNGELLCSESKIWSKVVTIMAGKAKELPPTEPKCRVGFRVPLTCVNHSRKTWMEEPEDWKTINGGCQKECGQILKCGHKCPLNCHPFDHDIILCRIRCSKTLPCGHECDALCGDLCVSAKCNVKFPEQADSSSLDLNSQQESSVDEWKGYAAGGYKQHDEAIRKSLHETLKEMDRVAEKDRHGLRDKFLDQQLGNCVDKSTIQAASSMVITIAKPMTPNTSSFPPLTKPSQSVSPQKDTSNLTATIHKVTRHRNHFKPSSDNEPLIGYAGTTASLLTEPKAFRSKINMAPLRHVKSPPPALLIPQHQTLPQHSPIHHSPSARKQTSLEDMVSNMMGRKSSSSCRTPAITPPPSKPIDSQNLIDFD